MKNNYAIILAGGGGIRLAPMSTPERPKQFIDLLNCGQTMIQLTYSRLKKFFPAENILVLTNEKYLNLINEQLPQVDSKNIFLEPAKKNTAPAIVYACHKLFSRDTQAKVLICPSDQFICPDEKFLEAVELGMNFISDNDALLTLGIKPTSPHTGYGYINFKNDQAEIKKVIQFIEKPDRKTAEIFLESGNYFWNAGIFMWSLKIIFEAFKKFTPELDEIISKVRFNTEFENNDLKQAFDKVEAISIDCAVLEKARNVFVLEANFKWSDLGSWQAIYDELKNKSEVVEVDKNFILCQDKPNIENRKYQLIDQQGDLLIYKK